MTNYVCANCGTAFPESRHGILRGSLSLMRHCRVPMNDRHIIIGSIDSWNIDDRPSEASFDEVRAAAKKFKASGKKAKRIITSPMARAVETANAFSGKLGFPPIFGDDRLRERSVGIYEGRQEFPGMLELFMGNTPIEGAEPIESLEERTESILAETAELYADEDTVFVTHTLPLLKMLGCATGADTKTLIDNPPKNCEVVTFRFSRRCPGCGSVFAKTVG